VATDNSAQLQPRQLMAEVNALQNKIKAESAEKRAELDKLVQEINQLQIAAIKEKDASKAKIVKAKTKQLYEAQIEHLDNRQKNTKQQIVRLTQARQVSDDARLQQQLDAALEKKKHDYSQLVKDVQAIHQKAKQKAIQLTPSSSANLAASDGSATEKKTNAMQRARSEIEKLIEDVKPELSLHAETTANKTEEAERLMEEIERLQEAAEKGSLTEDEMDVLEDRVSRIEAKQRTNREEINQLTQAKIKYELALSKAREERLAIQALKAQDAKLKDELNELIEEKENEQRQLVEELELIRSHAEQESAALKAQRDAARALADKQAQDSQVVSAEKSRRGLIMAGSITTVVLIVLGIYFFTPLPDMVRNRVDEILNPSPPPLTNTVTPPVNSANNATEPPQAETLKPQPGRPLSHFRDRLRSGGAGPAMVRLSEGSFIMGNALGSSNEKPEVLVEISEFSISKTEISVQAYLAFARQTDRRLPENYQHNPPPPELPMTQVNWHDAVAYTKWLTKETGHQYRLPSEREWEYAAKAGTESIYWWGNSLGKGNANCQGCGSEWDGRAPAPIQSFKANPFGLYDTVGNVMEWTVGCYHQNYQNAPTSGQLWEGGDCSKRVVRGSAYNTPKASLRASVRYSESPIQRRNNLGFRVVRVQ
jgi:formylglycine-generating enzyme required for sulfatase activity